MRLLRRRKKRYHYFLAWVGSDRLVFGTASMSINEQITCFDHLVALGKIIEENEGHPVIIVNYSLLRVERRKQQ